MGEPSRAGVASAKLVSSLSFSRKVDLSNIRAELQSQAEGQKASPEMKSPILPSRAATKSFPRSSTKKADLSNIRAELQAQSPDGKQGATPPGPSSSISASHAMSFPRSLTKRVDLSNIRAELQKPAQPVFVDLSDVSGKPSDEARGVVSPPQPSSPLSPSRAIPKSAPRSSTKKVDLSNIRAELQSQNPSEPTSPISPALVRARSVGGKLTPDVGNAIDISAFAAASDDRGLFNSLSDEWSANEPPPAPASAPTPAPETAKTPLATTLESFRGVLQKRESVTEGIVGKLRTLVPRTVPAVKRRPILLDVSAEGITVHDLGEKAYEESVTSGKVRGITVPLEFITGWQGDETRSKVMLVLSKDPSTGPFNRLTLHSIDAAGVVAALKRFSRERAASMEVELTRQQSLRALRASGLSRLGSFFSTRSRSDLSSQPSESFDTRVEALVI